MGRCAFQLLCALLLLGCAARVPLDSPRRIAVVDDGGDTLRLAAPAARVISLIPSGTDVLVALGAADLVVGRTRYDVDPAITARPSVGGGLDPSLEQIVALHPDVVIVQQTDTRGDLRRRLTELHIPTFALALQDTTDALRAIRGIGALIGRDSVAVALVTSMRAELAAVAASVNGLPRPRVFYVINNAPPMTVGPHTFIGQLLGVAGAENIFADLPTNWATVTMEEIIRRDPDVVVLPQGEYRANSVESLRQQAGWRELRAVRTGRVVLVDGNLVNRPGPHMGAAARALHDQLHPAGDTR